MKKWVLLGLIGLSLCFSGCGIGKEGMGETELKRGGENVYNEALITVGFIQTGKESGWRDASTNDFIHTFTTENGYYFIYIDGNSSPKRQEKAMYDLISQKVDYIILDPIVEEGWEEIMEAAKKAGIPVIIVDRSIDVREDLYACWIGSDFKEEGRQAVKWLSDYLEEEGREKERLRIVLLTGTEGASASAGRTEGIKEALRDHPDWEIVEERCANFTQGEGQSVMKQILKKDLRMDVLIAENDNMMFGAMKAMDNASVSYGPKGDVISISFDGLREAFEKMEEGKLHLTVECNPLLAGLTDKLIKKLEQGERVEKINYSEEGVYSYKNAADFIDNRLY